LHEIFGGNGIAGENEAVAPQARQERWKLGDDHVMGCGHHAE
jgi:hypothetical protein